MKFKSICDMLVWLEGTMEESLLFVSFNGHSLREKTLRSTLVPRF